MINRDSNQVNKIYKLLSGIKANETSKMIIPELEKYISFTDDNNINCEICLSRMEYANDKLVTCSVCQETTHQSCYGSNLLNLVISYGIEWTCMRCEEILNENMTEEEFATRLDKIR